jgi:hypothetical protein
LQKSRSTPALSSFAHSTRARAAQPQIEQAAAERAAGDRAQKEQPQKRQAPTRGYDSPDRRQGIKSSAKIRASTRRCNNGHAGARRKKNHPQLVAKVTFCHQYS